MSGSIRQAITAHLAARPTTTKDGIFAMLYADFANDSTKSVERLSYNLVMIVVVLLRTSLFGNLPADRV